MIDEENAKRVETWISEAQQQGAKLLCGGKRTNNFVEPAILTNSTKPDEDFVMRNFQTSYLHREICNN